MSEHYVKKLAARCWLCGGADLQMVKPARLPTTVDGTSFRITDANYGQGGAVFECRTCGFRECPDLNDVLRYYVKMDDPEYEASRQPRALQARKLLQYLSPPKSGDRLFDIGAGSGILIEEAGNIGYIAEGVEPSDWLAERAAERGLNVHHGVLPMPAVTGPFDVVTLVDVIEHVSDPLALLASAAALLSSDGEGLVITPDVGSLAARAMGDCWWHYRLAHICYFTKPTMIDALRRAGLSPVRIFRPSWYFSLGYLLSRLAVYAPLGALPNMTVFMRVTVPLNLFDSVGIVFKKA